MSGPYASAILATHDRHSTLPHSLASVQAQTERALEILIVLDGATPECRAVAGHAASTDDRIVVLDLPKDAGRGEQNVDRAVSSARGDRVFYIDDDDVWLPHHVASLGPLLDHADIADSRVCSVDRRGGLHLGPARASHPRMVDLLGSHRLKMLYDTHLAHRLDAYGRISRWHSDGATGDSVWDLLTGFARDPACRWASCDRVTALSLHGAARRDVSARDRDREAEHWLHRAGDLGDLTHATPLFHLFRLLVADPPTRGTLDGYLAAHGGYADVGRAPGGLEHALFALCSGSPPPPGVAVQLAVALSEPVESGYLFENITLACFEAYGQDEHERILRDVADAPGPNRAARLAAWSAAVSRRDVAQALELAQRAVALGPDPVGSLASWCERLEAQATSG